MPGVFDIRQFYSPSGELYLLLASDIALAVVLPSAVYKRIKYH